MRLNFKRIVKKVDWRVHKTVFLEKQNESERFVEIERHIPSI